LHWKGLKVLDYLAELVVKQDHTPVFSERLAWGKQKRKATDPLLDFSAVNKDESF